MFGCVFCYRHEDNPNIHICGKCVWRLMYASDEKIIEAHDLALVKGFTNKAEAIEDFTGIGGTEDGRDREPVNRRRLGGTIRLHEKPNKRFKKRTKITVHKNKQKK